LAAIASLSLAATLACVGAITGCGSSSKSTPTVDSGVDTGITSEVDSGFEDVVTADTFVGSPPDTGVIEAAVLPTLVAPTFTPPTGTALDGPSNVTITPPAGFPADGFIYYTTNGTNPNPNSLVYSGPIQVSQAETIRAFAAATGYQNSPIVFATYTVAAPPPSDSSTPTLTEPVFNQTSQTQNNDFKVAVSAGAGATICYTLDGVTTPTCNATGACTGSSLQYNSVSQIAISAASTNAAGAVTVEAIACENGATTSPVSNQVYTLQASAPTMVSPAPGNVLWAGNGLTPTIETTTTGASIWYTTNGTAPTCTTGTQLSSPHTFSQKNATPDGLIASTTYQAISCKQGYAASAVTSLAYTVQLNAPAFSPVGTGSNEGGPGTYDSTLTAGNLVEANTGVAGEWACATVDGSAPACGATQGTCTGTAASISSTGTPGSITKTGTAVKAIACAVGLVPSALASGTYVLQLDAPLLVQPGVGGNGQITSLTVTGGTSSCYTSDGCGSPTFTITIAAPPAGSGGTQATANVTLGSGQFCCDVNTGIVVTLVNPGSGYDPFNPPNVTITFDSPSCGNDWCSINPAADANVSAPPATTFAIPSGSVGSFTAVVEQDGTGQAYSFVCIQKGGTPVCGTNACNSGTLESCANNDCEFNNGGGDTVSIPPAGGSIVAGDAWSVIGCPASTAFLPSAVTKVTYGAPGSAPVPTITPGSGPFTAEQTPAILNTDTNSVTLCYTTDGTTPTCANGACGANAVGGAGGVALVGAGSATLQNPGFLITAGGSGYVSAPSVAFGGGGATSPATGTSTIKVTAIQVTNGGSGYLAAANLVTIVDTPGGGGSGATAVATLNGGSISSIAILTTGDNYTAPVVQITGPPGTGTPATATATGSVDNIIVSNIGAGYSTAPTITFTGSGSGAAATAYTTNSVIANALTSNTSPCVAGNACNTIEATVCNGTEAAPAAPATATYTFTEAEPDFTSPAGVTSSNTGDLNAATTVTGGEVITITTASNFPGQVINVTTGGGGAAPNCGTGIPATAAYGSAGTNTSVVTIPVPDSATNFTLTAIVCGPNTSAEGTSPPRSQTFETVSTAVPQITTDQTVTAGLTGCQATPCTPASPWDNSVNVTLTSATANAWICYTVTNQTLTCGTSTGAGTGTCNSGIALPNGTAIPTISLSGTKVQAIACDTTLGASAPNSQSFILDVSPVATPTQPACGGAVTLSLDDSNTTQQSGGPTPGAYICYTLGTAALSCTPAGVVSGSVTCGAVGADVTVPASDFNADQTVNWTTCVAQSATVSFTPTTGTGTFDQSAYQHSGAIVLDGNLGEWLPGEADDTNTAGPGYFTYQTGTLYFAINALPAASTGDIVAIYVGNGAAGGATAVPASLGTTALPTAGGLQYVIEWVVGSSAAPTVQVWNAVSGWSVASGITVNKGFNANGLEASVTLSSLSALGATPGTVTVVESIVSGPNTAGANSFEYTLGVGGANAELQHGFDVSFASCESPGTQLF
jgi:hypothetical protein